MVMHWKRPRLFRLFWLLLTGFANGAWSDRGSEPECPANDLADLDDWAELAGAGNAAGSMCQPPADGDADMTYEQLCQAHIEAFIQASTDLMTGCCQTPG